jgi:arylsulfatase A-like enzyme
VKRSFRKALVPAAAVALLSGCAPSKTTQQDLVELFPQARLEAETGLLDLGGPAARPYLVSGWSADERSAEGRSFVWAIGDSSRLRLFISEPRPLELSFLSWPFRFPRAPSQQISLRLNGAHVADVPLEDSSRVYRVSLPAEFQLAGDNVLEVAYRYHRSPRETLAGAVDPRELAVGWDWIRVEGAVEAPESIVDGESLKLPYGVRLEYVLDLKPESRLELGEVLPWGKQGPDPHLAVSTRTLSARDDRNVQGSSSRIEIPLSEERGLVALTLQARMGGGGIEREGGLLVKRPVVISRTLENAVAASRESKPNVVWIVVDTLRADHLGAYGYPGDTTPNIDTLAADASLFEQAFAQSSWTRPSVATLLTGLLPQSHTALGRGDALPTDAVTIAERLSRLGYRTAGFVTNTNVAAEFGFSQGFQTYELLLDEDGKLYAPAERVFARALDWLREARGEPFFLYVHATDPHDPYTPHRGGTESLGSTDFMEALEAGRIPSEQTTRDSLIALYDGKIRHLDRELGKFLEEMKRGGRYQDAMIVLVSDHGEEFEDHGWWRHGKTLYQEQLHVPLLIKWPNGFAAGVRVPDVVQQIDLVPTVLDRVGAAPGDDLPGRSLHRLLASKAESEPAVWSYLRSDGREVESVTYRGRKLVRTLVYDREVAAFALFDLARDRSETRNLVDADRTAFEFLEVLLRRSSPGPDLAPQPAAIDETTRRRLEAMGYLP